MIDSPPDDRTFFDAVVLACGALPETGRVPQEYIDTFAALAKAHYANTYGLLRKFEWTDFLSVKFTHFERWYHYCVDERGYVFPNPKFTKYY